MLVERNHIEKSTVAELASIGIYRNHGALGGTCPPTLPNFAVKDLGNGMLPQNNSQIAIFSINKTNYYNYTLAYYQFLKAVQSKLSRVLAPVYACTCTTESC